MAVINGRPPPLEGHILAGLGQKPGGESQPVAYLSGAGTVFRLPGQVPRPGWWPAPAPQIAGRSALAVEAMALHQTAQPRQPRGRISLRIVKHLSVEGDVEIQRRDARLEFRRGFGLE